VLERSYYPHFNLQSGVSARGSGANVDGTVGSGADGLGLQRENWVAGLSASFPVMDFFSIRARKQIAAANQRAEGARYQQTLQDIAAQVAQAQARLEGAIAIAQATPTELQAARDAETQARARYQAALANVIEVTDAQSLLIRAEGDEAVSKLNAWRAFVELAAAEGDFTQLLETVRSASPGGR
jgi:outer membrane protein TolC